MRRAEKLPANNGCGSISGLVFTGLQLKAGTPAFDWPMVFGSVPDVEIEVVQEFLAKEPHHFGKLLPCDLKPKVEGRHVF